MSNHRNRLLIGASWAAVVIVSTCAVPAYAQQYDSAGRQAAQRAAGYRQTRFPTTAYPTRSPYNRPAPEQVSRAVHHQDPRQSSHEAVAAYDHRDYQDEEYYQEEVRPVHYRTEVTAAGESTSTEMSMPVEVMESPNSPTNSQPVEIIDGGYDSCDSCGTSCESCATRAPGICDPAYHDKNCNRGPCPCPSEEALSYYRCNFYGHYPTLWRSFPEGFLRHRPEPTLTFYDRFRKAPKGMERSNAGRDQDLDKQLKDLLKEQQPKDGRDAGPEPTPGRQAPDLLPDDATRTPPNAAPGPNDGSSNYPSRRPYQHGVRRVNWER